MHNFMDKQAVEEFIQAFLLIASNAVKIKRLREKGDQTLEALIFWYTQASANPHSHQWTNGFVVAMMVIQSVYTLEPIDPEVEAVVRPAMEALYPNVYPVVG